MKRYLLLLTCLISFATIGIAQEQNNRPRRQFLTPEEFQNKQKEFIIKHADLTEKESTAFFPLYFELQNKKHEANHRVWKRVRAVPPHERTEEECEIIINALADMKIECAELEKDYLQKFKEILSAKKIVRIQIAEDRFQRELLKGMQQGSSKKHTQKNNQASHQ